MPDTDSPADENDEKTLLEARVRALEIDLRQKKEIILAQHTQLEAFSGSSIDALVQMDFDGHITGWNKQAEKIFGWAADDILDQRIDETIIPPRYRAAHAKGLKRFLENGETIEQGALRETVEEAGADVTLIRLFAVFSLPHVSQVYMTYLADLRNLDFKPGVESLEVKLVTRDEVPWSRIAFRAIEFFLERYFLLDNLDHGVHEGFWVRDKDGPWIRGGKR